MRRVLFVLLLASAVVASALPSSAGAATVKNPASLVIKTTETMESCAQCGPGGSPSEYPQCTWGVYVQVPDVPGARSYTVVLKDNHPLINATRTLTGPPFNDDDAGYKTPAGAHWFGPITAGGGPPPCPSDPYERFDILRSTAAFGKEGRIVGTVSRTDGGSVAGVRVSARGPRNASATTNEAGTFNMKVKRGRYTVSAPGYCVKRKGRAGACDRSATVSVTTGPEQVDFRAPFRPGFEARAHAPVQFEEPAVDVTFKGTGWDPEGGPITIRWSGRPKWTHLFSPDDGNDARNMLTETPTVLKIPAAAEFDGRLVSEVWPRHPTIDREGKCSGRVTASQDGASVERTVSSDRLRGVVLWSEGEPDFEREDLFCDGEYTESPPLVGGPVTYPRGMLLIYDVPSGSFGFYRGSPKAEVPFVVGGPGPNECKDGGPCVSRVACIDKRGSKDIAIYWNLQNVRRGRLDFAWRTGRACRSGEGGFVFAD